MNDVMKGVAAGVPTQLGTISVLSITAIWEQYNRILANAISKMKSENLSDSEIELDHEGLLILGDSIQTNLMPANFKPATPLEREMVEKINLHRPAIVEIFLAAGAEKLPAQDDLAGATQAPATTPGLLN